MNWSNPTLLATLIAYHASLIAIGLWASKRAATNREFLIGGRNLNGWVAGLSYAATSSSAWVLMGFSGFVYAVGLKALWILPGVWGGYVIVWAALGEKIRRRAQRHDCATFVDLIAGDTSKRMQRWTARMAGAMILFCFTFYIAAQLQAAGGAMHTYFDLSHLIGVLIAVAIVGVYSLLGGFWAVSLTDTIQGLAMAALAILLPAAAVIAAGPGEIIAAAQSPAGAPGAPALVAAGTALGMMSIGLGTLGQPQLIARAMAVKSAAERRKAFGVAMTWSLTVFTGMAALGLAARALFPEHAVLQNDPEKLIFVASDRLLADVVAGLALAALLSAIMSTVDSILLATSAAVSHDMHLPTGRPLLLSRLAMVALMVGAAYLATSAPATIFERVLFAWTALGAAFGPLLLARLANWRIAPHAAAGAMAIGFALAVTFSQLLDPGPGNLYERALPWLPALALLYAAHRWARRRGGD